MAAVGCAPLRCKTSCPFAPPHCDLYCHASLMPQYPAQPFSPSKWESGHPHMQMYHSLLSMVGKHTWGSEEQDLLLKFKARYGEWHGAAEDGSVIFYIYNHLGGDSCELVHC